MSVIIILHVYANKFRWGMLRSGHVACGYRFKNSVRLSVECKHWATVFHVPDCDVNKQTFYFRVQYEIVYID